MCRLTTRAQDRSRASTGRRPPFSPCFFVPFGRRRSGNSRRHRQLYSSLYVEIWSRIAGPLELALRARTLLRGLLATCLPPQPSVAFYETVSLRLQTLELMLDTLLMRTLLVYAESTTTDISNLAGALSEALGPKTDADLHHVPKVYIRWLNFQPLRVLLSCRSVAGGHGLERLADGAPPGVAGLLHVVSTMLSNIDRAPLRLKERRCAEPDASHTCAAAALLTQCPICTPILCRRSCSTIASRVRGPSPRRLARPIRSRW